MSKSTRKSQLVVFGGSEKKPTRGPKAAAPSARLAAAEAEREVLLRLMPDEVFRIKANKDGTFSVRDARSRIEITTDRPTDLEKLPPKEEVSGDLSGNLRGQLASRSRQLIDGVLKSGEMQTLDFLVECGGRSMHYEVRAAACAPWELLAVATDVTARKEAECSIARSLNEVARLNEILQSEATLHAEDEQIMDNAFAKLGKLLEDTIGAIQMIVHQKDPPTAHHQARVCKLACAIAREMGLVKGQVDTIGLAALLHDLGKVFIPSETLNKPGPLTEAEFAAVKNSAETEFLILKTVDLFYPIADIVHQHHERLDGSGYPRGLKNDDIMIEARIIAVSDVVEAMVSERPYRPARTLEAALYEIRTGKGTLYDADAVDACISLFEHRRFEFGEAEADMHKQEAAYSGA